MASGHPGLSGSLGCTASGQSFAVGHWAAATYVGKIPGLVNTQKIMERSTLLMDKSTISTGPFSIARLNYQRVCLQFLTAYMAGWWFGNHNNNPYIGNTNPS